MMKALKQARAAFSMLDPKEVRNRANRDVRVGLVASGRRGYERMEGFLLPGSLARGARSAAAVHRADDPAPPENVDVVFYERGVPPAKGAYTLDPDNPGATVAQIMNGEHEELAMPLARQFPAFRKCVVDRIVQAVARENALFAIATALPNVVPNLIELPWAFGEFASDTAFLTANQIRMAFLIAGACGGEVGYAQQKGEVLAIVAGAFGWRAIARELAGKIPLGGGLIPKGAIAYAGTAAVGKGLEYYHHTQAHLPREESQNAFRQAFERGRQVAEAFVAERRT